MKKLFKFVLVAISMILAMGVVSCNKDNTDDPSKKTPAKYTIMLYGCGGANVDCQLEDALEPAVKALGVESNQVRYTVMYSMSATDKDFGAYFRGEKGKTYRYELSKDTDLTKAGYRQKYFYKNAKEVELYKASTIVEYIKWAKETAPAENYIIEFVNHGGGFDLGTETLTKGIAYDDNHKDKDGDDTGIAISTIAYALKTAGVPMKAIYWNGCLMGQLEVLTEVAPYCDYQFMSSHVAYTNNVHTVGLIKALNEKPNDFEAAALAHEKILYGNGEDDKNSFVYDFANATDEKTKKPAPVNGDFGCWRSNKVTAINEQVKKLGALLVKAYRTDEKEDINNASKSVYVYELNYGYIDVLDYAQNLAFYLTDATDKAEAEAIATNMKTAIDAANVYRVNCVYLHDAGGKKVTTKAGTFSLGISLYAGKVEHDVLYKKWGGHYKTSAFDNAVGWSNWLDINEHRVSADKEHPNLYNPANDTSWELFWLDNEEDDEEGDEEE